MKKIRKSHIFSFILGAIIFGSMGVIAANYAAKDISFTPKDSTWKKSNGEDITNVKDAIDELYAKTKMCKRLSEGTGLTIGTKYECILGDKDNNNNYIKRNFFIIAINSNNTVDLIMERNITEGSSGPDSLDDAINYFKTGDGVTYTNIWKNVVEIKIPSASMIANAVNGNEYSHLNLGNNKWLYNYLKGCSQYSCDENTSLSEPEDGSYWTSTAGDQDGRNISTHARIVADGKLTVSYRNNSTTGIRPVITVLKSQLN